MLNQTTTCLSFVVSNFLIKRINSLANCPRNYQYLLKFAKSHVILHNSNTWNLGKFIDLVLRKFFYSYGRNRPRECKVLTKLIEILLAICSPLIRIIRFYIGKLKVDIILSYGIKLGWQYWLSFCVVLTRNI